MTDDFRLPSPLVGLVVDDSELYAYFVRVVLEEQGFDVHVAHARTRAEELAATDPPAIVFVDHGLPDSDGGEFCRWLRARPETRGCAIVLLSGAGGELRALAPSYGADVFLEKTSDRTAVHAAIRAAFASRRSGR